METQLHYQDPTLAVDDRVADLLGRMTVEEKIAQLGSIWAFEIVGDDGLNGRKLDELLGAGLGEITRLAGSTNLQPAEVARTANEIQRYLVERTRLGIPAIVHEECLHGLLAWAAPCFQQAIGAAASFDPELLGEVAATIRRRMLATGARHALGPVLDITRDPRWGRIEETYGEDPYLAATMGVAYIRALQGPTLSDGVIATGKHLVGHGMAEGGLNQAPVHVGWRELRDEQLFPFEAAVREAGRENRSTEREALLITELSPTNVDRRLVETTFRHAVADEVLAGGDHPVAEGRSLQGADIGHAHRGREVRILPIGLLDPTPTRVAGDVENGAKRVSGARGEHSSPDGRGNLPEQLRVEGGGRADRLLEARRRPGKQAVETP